MGCGHITRRPANGHSKHVRVGREHALHLRCKIACASHLRVGMMARHCWLPFFRLMHSLCLRNRSEKSNSNVPFSFLHVRECGAQFTCTRRIWSCITLFTHLRIQNIALLIASLVCSTRFLFALNRSTSFHYISYYHSCTSDFIHISHRIQVGDPS